MNVKFCIKCTFNCSLWIKNSFKGEIRSELIKTRPLSYILLPLREIGHINCIGSWIWDVQLTNDLFLHDSCDDFWIAAAKSMPNNAERGINNAQYSILTDGISVARFKIRQIASLPRFNQYYLASNANNIQNWSSIRISVLLFFAKEWMHLCSTSFNMNIEYRAPLNWCLLNSRKSVFELKDIDFMWISMLLQNWMKVVQKMSSCMDNSGQKVNEI